MYTFMLALKKDIEDTASFMYKVVLATSPLVFVSLFFEKLPVILLINLAIALISMTELIVGAIRLDIEDYEEE